MIVFSEEKVGHQSIFFKKILDTNENVINVRKVTSPLYQADKDGYTYFILYDDHMNVNIDVYEFLNYDMYDKPLTSRAKAAFALRLLYCFLSLSGYKDNKLNIIELKELIYFLKGLNSIPNTYVTRTQRSASTVNGYLAIYRAYFSSRSIKCSSLFKSNNIAEDIIIGNDCGLTASHKKYKHNLKVTKYASDTVPKYISPDDFRKLYKLAISNNDKTTKILLHLMYGYGLRLGEALGLTLEDIQEVYDNGKLIPALFLRNRISDNKFQFAKGMNHVLDIKQYSSKDYQLSRQKIIITYTFYEELLMYIEETHTIKMDKFPNNYELGAADIVSIRNKPESNHYVFLNRYGRILSDQTWNNSLKKYFKLAAIPLDFDIKENNLSHRFRHGFAMFHARFSEHPVDVLTLQKLLRHKSVSSTMIYFNPTLEDELEIKSQFQTELYNMIPELKEDLNV